jgi:hypothetical protein
MTGNIYYQTMFGHISNEIHKNLQNSEFYRTEKRLQTPLVILYLNKATKK